MIVGTGIDIVEISRLKASVDKFGDAFLRHVYSQRERDCQPKNDGPRMAYLAGRWAAKEALSKALGTGIGADCPMQDIDISNDENGQPHITLLGTAKATAERLGITHLHISISHEQEYAVASVIAEK